MARQRRSYSIGNIDFLDPKVSHEYQQIAEARGGKPRTS
jgi:hypothetical protein